MERDTPDYWFAVKRYGWGWGMPARWQGWAVLALYFGTLYITVRYFPPRNDVVGFLLLFTLASVVLVAIIVWKGEKPVGWRWGD